MVLSEDGRLEVCYLGSEPSLFVVTPLHPRGFDYAAAEQRLAELRALLKGNRDSGKSDRRGTFRADGTGATKSPRHSPQRIAPARQERTRS